MRLIDADALMADRVENDPVRIEAMCAPTVECVTEKELHEMLQSFVNAQIEVDRCVSMLNRALHCEPEVKS